MADHGRLDPEEPDEGPGPGPHDPQGGGARDPRDPVALAAWRRVAAQRGRRAARGDDRDDDASDGAGDAEPATVEVPAPTTGGSVPTGATGDRWTASRPPPGFGADPRGSRPALPHGPYGAPREHGGRPSVGSLHDTLLGLAGRIDDDALSWVRELVAVEDDAGAAELLSGCLLADAVAISATERSVLAPWFSATRVDSELLELLPVDDAARERHGHRFVGDVHADGPERADGDGVDVVARAAGRLPGVVAVVQCWRVTPAGASSGPLPHRVLLVTTDPGVDSEHVAHHVAYAARELGAVSVEVLTAGADLPAYHRDALGAAVPVLAAAVPESAVVSAAAPAGAAPAASAPVVGEPVSEADMLLAELPSSPHASPTLPEPGAPDVADEVADEAGDGAGRTEPADPLPTDRVADVGGLDPDEAAARIAALWSTPAPVDDPPADEPVADRGSEVPSTPVADPPADGVVPRARTSRTARADRPDPEGAPPAQVNGHHHGTNGAHHDDLGAQSGTASAGEPPTDPVGWPFVADDGPAGVDGLVNGWHDESVPAGPTGPTPLAPPDAWSAAEDPMPELSDRERELLARLHAELAARELASDPNPPTTPLPAGGDTASGGGPVNGQGLPPWTADDRGEGPADRP